MFQDPSSTQPEVEYGTDQEYFYNDQSYANNTSAYGYEEAYTNNSDMPYDYENEITESFMDLWLYGSQNNDVNQINNENKYNQL